jgi:hypothetical protein
MVVSFPVPAGHMAFGGGAHRVRLEGSLRPEGAAIE